MAIMNKEAIHAIKQLPKYQFSETTYKRKWAEMKRIIAPNDKQFVFHVFRHTCATNMASNLAMSKEDIGTQLGHRSPQTTEKYIHKKDARKLAIAQKLQGGVA